MKHEALRVTFYSYKGGVGRTLALLNVGAELARSGHRVVCVDLDLEAPGFGLSHTTLAGEEPTRKGVAEFLLGREVGSSDTIKEFGYPLTLDDADPAGHLWLMPSGQRALELAHQIPEFYKDLQSEQALLFQLLVAELNHDLQPDFILFDSRTGKADAAGVCTMELAQVLVAVCGLNDQNVRGMGKVLDEVLDEKNNPDPLLALGVLSPVPRKRDIEEDQANDSSLVEHFRQSHTLTSSHVQALATHTAGHHGLLMQRLNWAREELESRLNSRFERDKEYFPKVKRRDLLSTLEYHPLVPLSPELKPPRELAAAYGRMAEILLRTHPTLANTDARPQP